MTPCGDRQAKTNAIYMLYLRSGVFLVSDQGVIIFLLILDAKPHVCPPSLSARGESNTVGRSILHSGQHMLTFIVNAQVNDVDVEVSTESHLIGKSISVCSKPAHANRGLSGNSWLQTKYVDGASAAFDGFPLTTLA